MPVFLTSSVLAVGPGGTPSWATAVALKRAAEAETDEVTPGRALALWVGQLLFRELPENQEAIGNFLGAVIRENKSYDVWEFQAVGGDPKPPALVLTAGTHLSMSCIGGVWELVGRGRWVAAPPVDWLESRVFNLRTLYASLSPKAEKHATKTAKVPGCTTMPPPASGSTKMPPPSV